MGGTHGTTGEVGEDEAAKGPLVFDPGH